MRSRLEAANRHCRALEAERNGAQERLAASQAREEALSEVSLNIFVNMSVQAADNRFGQQLHLLYSIACLCAARAISAALACLAASTRAGAEAWLHMLCWVAATSLQDLQQQQAQHKEQLSAANHKLQLAVQERAEAQRQVLALQQQLQAAADKAVRASTAAAAVSRQHSLQPPHRQDGSSAGTLLGASTALDESLAGAMQSAESGLAGLGLEDQETPGNRSGSRFSLASVQSQPSAANAAAAALGRRASAGTGSQAANGSGKLQPGSSGLGLASQLSSGTSSPMASQARLQQLSGSLSGLLSSEGQLQLQRAVQQLQQELSVVTRERDAAAEQLYQMVRQADAAAAALQETEKLKQQQEQLQHKVCLHLSWQYQQPVRSLCVVAHLLPLSSVTLCSTHQQCCLFHVHAQPLPVACPMPCCCRCSLMLLWKSLVSAA